MKKKIKILSLLCFVALIGLTIFLAASNSWIFAETGLGYQVYAGLLWFRACVYNVGCETYGITKLGDYEEPIKTSGIVCFVIIAVSAVCQVVAFVLILMRYYSSKWKEHTKKIDIICNLLMLLAIFCLFTSWIFYLVYNRNLLYGKYNYGLYMTIITSLFSVLVVVLTNLPVLKIKNKYIQL